MSARDAAAPGVSPGRGAVEINGSNSNTTSNRPPSKRARVIRALLLGSKTTFDLERVGDHCAPSTISELRRAGLVIHAELVAVPGYAGEKAHCARYTLDEECRALAIALMTKTGRRRGNE